MNKFAVSGGLNLLIPPLLKTWGEVKPPDLTWQQVSDVWPPKRFTSNQVKTEITTVWAERSTAVWLWLWSLMSGTKPFILIYLKRLKTLSCENRGQLTRFQKAEHYVSVLLENPARSPQTFAQILEVWIFCLSFSEVFHLKDLQKANPRTLNTNSSVKLLFTKSNMDSHWANTDKSSSQWDGLNDNSWAELACQQISPHDNAIPWWSMCGVAGSPGKKAYKLTLNWDGLS